MHWRPSETSLFVGIQKRMHVRTQYRKAVPACGRSTKAGRASDPELLGTRYSLPIDDTDYVNA